MATSPALSRFRLILWILVLLAAIAATALFFLRPPSAPAGVTGTPFQLDSTKGGDFTQDDLQGTPSLVFFGYTFCPDVCPTTLAESVSWRESLDIKPDQLRTIFVTVDPQRDTKDVLTQYLGSFDSNIIGLVGTPEQTEDAKAAFGVFSENQKPDEYGNYLVNHTATVFLMDRKGQLQSTIAYGEDTSSALAKIKRLIGS